MCVSMDVSIYVSMRLNACQNLSHTDWADGKMSSRPSWAQKLIRIFTKKKCLMILKIVMTFYIFKYPFFKISVDVWLWHYFRHRNETMYGCSIDTAIWIMNRKKIVFGRIVRMRPSTCAYCQAATTHLLGISTLYLWIHFKEFRTMRYASSKFMV